MPWPISRSKPMQKLSTNGFNTLTPLFVFYKLTCFSLYTAFLNLCVEWLYLVLFNLNLDVITATGCGDRVQVEIARGANSTRETSLSLVRPIKGLQTGKSSTW